MRDESIRKLPEGESPGHTASNNTAHNDTQRLRKSGFWLNGKLRISLLGAAAAVALFVASCGSSNSEEVLTAPQAPPETTAVSPPETTAVAPASTVPSVPAAEQISAAEADIGFDAGQTCNQASDNQASDTDGEADDAEFASIMAGAGSISEAFPNLSAEAAEGSAAQDSVSPAQLAAFTMAGCDVSVEELQNMAQDGQIGVETSRLIQAITSENLVDFPNAYMESTCLRAGSDNENQVLSAPHRMSRIVAALRDTWLAVQQPDPEEFQQVMTSVGEELAAQVWNAFFGEEDGELTLNEQSEAEAAQMRESVQQTCGYEVVVIDS